MIRVLRCSYSHFRSFSHYPSILNKTFSTVPNVISEHSFKKVSVENKVNFLNEDSNAFGTLKKDLNSKLSAMPEEEGDVVSFDITDETGRKKSRNISYYVKLIKEYIEQGKLIDAIDVLEIKMREDRVKPNYYAYNLLINACAKYGLSDKAFKLFNQMKKRGVKVTPAAYTGLFNAYANAPHTEDKLDKINHLRELILEKNYDPNIINYHAMIKAYSRCGDILSAFCIADEMVKKRFSLSNTTFSFLLQACISDREAGFRHALLLWRKMKVKHIRVDIFNYNLLLRCTRDCGLGDENVAKNAIERLVGYSLPNVNSANEKMEDSHLVKLTEAAFSFTEIPAMTNETPNIDKDENDQSCSTELIDLSSIENVPNLLAERPHLGSIITLGEVKKPEDRLLLLGGYKGVLKAMEADGVKPDNKTFSLLLETIPSTVAAEKKLLIELAQREMKPDLSFCNILIKRRSLRCEYDNAREGLRLLQDIYATPDIMTFGALAIGCKNLREANCLIHDMESFGYCLNTEILGAMMHQACYNISFNYIVFLMKYSLEHDIRPNRKFLEQLQTFHTKLRIWKKARKNKHTMKDMPKFIKEGWFVEGMRMFLPYYEEWLKRIKKEDIKGSRKLFRKKVTGNPNETDTDKYEKKRRPIVAAEADEETLTD